MTMKQLIAAQHLVAGQGGIARLARLTVQALENAADVTALAVEDKASHAIGSVKVRGYGGSRFRFALQNNLALIGADAAIYDFPGTGRAHLLPGKPYAVWVVGNELWNEPVVRQDYIRVIRGAKLVLAISQATFKALHEKVGNLPSCEVCLLATEEEEESPLGPPQGPPALLVFGRHDSYFAKGQDILIRLWPQIVSVLPDARLVFVGGGPMLAELRRLAAASPARANIDVRGFVEEKFILPVWQQATALALLSTLEGFGLVIVEAMRHGRPVLASTLDAGCEVNVDGVTGFNVDRRNDGEVVAKVLALLGDNERARNMGEAGRLRWRTHFRPSSFRERLLPILHQHLWR
jgi:phosphatidylinositol alpha-1,6-mannosyltransferase